MAPPLSSTHVNVTHIHDNNDDDDEEETCCESSRASGASSCCSDDGFGPAPSLPNALPTSRHKQRLGDRRHPALESSALLGDTVADTDYGGTAFCGSAEQGKTPFRPEPRRSSRMSIFQSARWRTESSHSGGGIQAQRSRSTQKQRPPPRSGKSLWKRLKKNVQDGQFLVQEPDSIQTKNSLESLHQQRQQEIRSGMSFSVGQCVLAILLYELLSIVCFSEILEPDWTVIDSSYFAVATFTTVGYGDLAPTTTASKIFTCFYALTGVAFLGLALGVIGSNLIESQTVADKTIDEVTKFQAMTLFDYHAAGADAPASTGAGPHTNRRMASTQHLEAAAAAAVAANPLLKSAGATPWFDFWSRCNTRRFFIFLVPLLAMAYVIGSHWDIVSILYYFVITACTIGYGDITPQTQTEKALAILFIPLACGIAGAWLSLVASYIMEQRSLTYRKNMESQELSMEDLYIMDKDGDGEVSRAEFLEFVLVAMNKIDQDLVDELRAYFDRLDTTGSGVLNRQCLVDAAKSKLRCPRRKLELSMYKQKLREQAERADLRNRRRATRQNVLTTLRDNIRRVSGFDTTLLQDLDFDDIVDEDEEMDDRQRCQVDEEAGAL